MNIYTKFKSIIFDIFLDVTKVKIDNINSLSEKFTVELPRDINHGDMSTNICLVLSSFVEKVFSFSQIFCHFSSTVLKLYLSTKYLIQFI